MHQFMKELKNKVDKVVQAKVILREEKEKLDQMKKNGVPLAIYQQQVKNILRTKQDAILKINDFNGAEVVKVMRPLGFNHFELGRCLKPSHGTHKTSFLLNARNGSFDDSPYYDDKFIENLLKKATGQNYSTKRLLSKYFLRNTGLVGNYMEAHFSVFALEDGTKYFEDEPIYNDGIDHEKDKMTQKRLIQLILDKKVILVESQPLFEKRAKNSMLENQLKDYVFKIDMLSEPNSLYDKLYPNLRNAFWQLVDENFVKTLQAISAKMENDINNISEIFQREIDSLHKIVSGNIDSMINFYHHDKVKAISRLYKDLSAVHCGSSSFPNEDIGEIIARGEAYDAMD